MIDLNDVAQKFTKDDGLTNILIQMRDKMAFNFGEPDYFKGRN